MTKQVTEIRLFVASPGDVLEEKDSLTAVKEELNSVYGRRHKFVIDVLDWRTHCYPAAGRTQGVINAEIGEYDIFLGIMWNRFGTPTGMAESGTKEEFDIAYERWKSNNKLKILFYFSKALSGLDTTEELEQRRKVLEFKKELESKLLAWEYSGPSEFPNIVRKHIANTIFDILEDQSQGDVPEAETEGSIYTIANVEFQSRPESDAIQEEEPITVPDRNVTADSPEIVAIREKLEEHVTSGAPITNSLLVRADLKCDDGERASIDYIQLDITDPNPAQLTLSNEKQPVPWKLSLIVNFVAGNLNLTWGIKYHRLNVKRELEALRFHKAMAKGGELKLVHLDSDFVFQTIRITPGVMEMPDERWINIVEKLVSIQRKARFPIHIPEPIGEFEQVSANEIRHIYETAQILETGRTSFQFSNWKSAVNLQTAKNIVGAFASGKPVSFSLNFDKKFVEILGTKIPLGPVVLTCERTIMLPEDYAKLKAATETVPPPASIPVRFESYENAPMWAHYLNWLPPKDRDFIVNQMQEGVKENIEIRAKITPSQINLLKHYAQGGLYSLDILPTDKDALLEWGLIELKEPQFKEEQYSGSRTKRSLPPRYQATEKGKNWLNWYEGEQLRQG